MKEIVIISGKGGTGKTSITASLAYLAQRDAVIADCDVDAADMHLLLMPDRSYSEDFYSGKMASIDSALCTNCGACKEICRFDAIPVIDGKHLINEIDCEGCGYCAKICPVDAIKMNDNLTGKFYISNTCMNNKLVHAELGIAAENSGKLVSKVRQEAQTLAKKTATPYVIIDGSPGIGCPVIASITGADFVIIVTEPTISGFHDLCRVSELVKKFKIQAGCIINKSDLNIDVTEKIKEYIVEEEIELLAELPYDDAFTGAITSGVTVVEYAGDSAIKSTLINSWNKIKMLV